MSVAVVDPPAPFVELDLAKAHLRVDHGDDDTLIGAYIAAACAALDGPDGWLRRAIGLQTLRAHIAVPWMAYHDLDLPCPPVVEIVSISDVSGAAPLVLDPAGWVVAANGVRALALATHRCVQVVYRAGYEITPPPIVTAALMMVGDLYANREAQQIDQSKGAAVANPTVEALLAPYRAWRC